MRTISGLYAVTPDEIDTAKLIERTAAAVAGGARLVQYRNKTASDRLRREQAIALAAVCRPAHVPLIINDHVDLALDIGADGVHLGRDDGEVARARAKLGTGRIVGVSCYDDIARAVRARVEGADYVAFGGFFPSSTKPGIAPSSPAILARAKEACGLAVIAIGGITAANGAALVAAGADALAVISALYGAPDVKSAALALCALFDGTRS